MNNKHLTFDDRLAIQAGLQQGLKVGFRQCFNDALGFRLRFEQYLKEYPDYLDVAYINDKGHP